MSDFLFADNCLYKIVSALDQDMVLDISQIPKDKNNAIVYKWHNAQNQLFAFRSVGQGKVAIFCAKNNLVLIPQKGSAQVGARIKLGLPKKQPYQFWTIESAKHNKLKKYGYYIKTFCGKSLDICNSKCENETPIIQWPHHGGLNQIWHIQPIFQPKNQ